MKNILLDGTWKFRAIDRYKRLPAEHRNALRWMNGKVPGTVHTDLMSNRIIRDPFYRTNELDVQWVEELQWEYTRSFTISTKYLEQDYVLLAADGLDTYATICINGRFVGATDNMFVGHRFDVKKFLHRGKNTINILFDSPTIRSKSIEKKYGPLRVALEPHRVYVRKAQYSFSWDWGPKLTTSGIWKSISLRAHSGWKISNPFVKIVSLDNSTAVVEVTANIDRYGSGPLRVRAYIGGNGSSIEKDVRVRDRAVRFQVSIPNPRLWWPNGYGDQPMYTALLTLVHDGEDVDQAETQFALRTVKLLQERDTEGRSFVLEVNGVKIYCKGADWIPGDSFIPRITGEKYRALLQMARDAHMNMIRVWGGGIYEHDCFYDLCDELGLMVWQDFMFACGEYPDRPWFLNQVRTEAEEAVCRLRNHPSIVVWCGNNECEWLFCTEHPGKTPDDMIGSIIFRQVLPRTCAFLDGTRPYWRSSPFGSGFPNDESNGNHHQWMVWSYWKDYPEYERDRARFVTEFGFQAPANRRTFEEVTISPDRFAQSVVMEHHNKQVEGTERLLRFQSAHFRLGDSFDDFIYQGQLVQADALKCAVEHWRRRKFSTAGSLFWQLNDCWPVSSWAVIDSALRPKAAYFAAKRFFQPVLLSFRRKEGGLECWVTNDLLDRVDGTVELSLSSFTGKIRWKKNIACTISKNSSARIFSVSDRILNRMETRTTYLFGRLRTTNEHVSENRFFFSEPKHWEKKEGSIVSEIRQLSSGKFAAALRSDVYAKAVRFEIEGEDVFPDDNYFDLDPGKRKQLIFTSALRVNELRKRIRLRWI